MWKRKPKRAHESRGLMVFATLTALLLIFRTALKKFLRWQRTHIAQQIPFEYLATTSDHSHCDIEGLRFLSGALPGEEIASLTGRGALDPIRVYAGLKSAADPADRVLWAVSEMDRLGGWERDLILLVQPTGRGYVHPIPMETLEISHGGNVAIVALQYADDRSMRAVGRVNDAILMHKLFLEEAAARGKQVYVYGESLGAWGSLETMRELNGANLPAGALWVGMPYPVRKSSMGDVLKRLSTNHKSTGFIEYKNGELLLGAEKHEYYFLTNDSDPIAYFNGIWSFLLPNWWIISRKKWWLPAVSWAKMVLEVEQETRPAKGVMGTKGHDYRGHMPTVIPHVFNGNPLGEREISYLIEREQDRHRIFSFLYAKENDTGLEENQNDQ